ncbi:MULTISPECIES: hypothetical protein [Saccharothrix]|uniref:hypothetical protein n=1 Tax=Saccharothrix TaxID=2071 RepID=UPI00093C48ED|nr:hypothetical protein [Saccharothrix sp. CB00851]OKI31513.1 hypothetical protein A6A25_27360 [Saccharothrix sp. CB00851]
MAAEPPAAPYTAFTAHFAGWGYIDGNFSYERSRSTVNVYQQNANGYALSMMASTTGHHHSFNVSPPNGTRFEAGRSYPAQTGFYTSDSVTIFNIGGDGQGCEGAAATSGTLNVHEAVYDESNGQFTAFAADYSMQCGSAGRVAKGEIRFQSSIGYQATDSWAYRLQFGRQPADQQGTPMEVPVEVNGTLPTTFGEASLSGADPAAFRITGNTCSGNTLSYGQKCALTITPTATELGEQTAVLTLLEDSVAGSVRRLLSLEGYDARTDEGTYYPLSPSRVLDTRSGLGAPVARVGSGQALRLQLTGRGGVPVEASTVVLNVTVTEPVGSGHISVYPTGVPRPTVSSLNYTPGWTGANSVTVKVGADGAVNLYNHGAAVHLVADVNGYYSKGRPCCQGYMGGQYQALARPVRLADTREWGNGRLPAGYYINVTADWGDDINWRIRAFAVNITATEPKAAGFLTAWNGNKDNLPNTSALNYAANTTVTNFAVVPSANCYNCGKVLPGIGVYTSQDTHVIVDIVGFYDDASLPGGLRFEPIVPSRIADTRTGQGWPSALGPATTATIVAPDSLVHDQTWALATNVTAVEPTAATYLTVWPAGYTGITRPNTSNLNPAAGTVVPNAVQTMIGPDYGFHVYNNAGRSHVLVDVVGTFYDASPSSGSAEPTSRTASADTSDRARVAPLPTPKVQPLSRPRPA